MYLRNNTALQELYFLLTHTCIQFLLDSTVEVDRRVQAASWYSHDVWGISLFDELLLDAVSLKALQSYLEVVEVPSLKLALFDILVMETRQLTLQQWHAYCQALSQCEVFDLQRVRSTVRLLTATWEGRKIALSESDLREALVHTAGQYTASLIFPSDSPALSRSYAMAHFFFLCHPSTRRAMALSAMCTYNSFYWLIQDWPYSNPSVVAHDIEQGWLSPQEGEIFGRLAEQLYNHIEEYPQLRLSTKSLGRDPVFQQITAHAWTQLACNDPLFAAHETPSQGVSSPAMGEKKVSWALFSAENRGPMSQQSDKAPCLSLSSQPVIKEILLSELYTLEEKTQVVRLLSNCPCIALSQDLLLFFKHLVLKRVDPSLSLALLNLLLTRDFDMHALWKLCFQTLLATKQRRERAPVEHMIGHLLRQGFSFVELCLELKAIYGAKWAAVLMGHYWEWIARCAPDGPIERLLPRGMVPGIRTYARSEVFTLLFFICDSRLWNYLGNSCLYKTYGSIFQAMKSWRYSHPESIASLTRLHAITGEEAQILAAFGPELERILAKAPSTGITPEWLTSSKELQTLTSLVLSQLQSQDLLRYIHEVPAEEFKNA